MPSGNAFSRSAPVLTASGYGRSIASHASVQVASGSLHSSASVFSPGTTHSDLSLKADTGQSSELLSTGCPVGTPNNLTMDPAVSSSGVPSASTDSQLETHETSCPVGNIAPKMFFLWVLHHRVLARSSGDFCRQIAVQQTNVCLAPTMSRLLVLVLIWCKVLLFL